MRYALARMIAVVVLLAAPITGAHAEPLGVATAVRPDATGTLGGSRVRLLKGSELHEGQTIATDARGEVQIVLSDDTHLVVGPGSSLVIETYLMRNARSVEKLAINALAGTFRFVTGRSDKDAYAINTPTGTIGVRGTEFDFRVRRGGGETTVILYSGKVRLCGRGGSCATIAKRCGIGVLPRTGPAALVASEAQQLDIALNDFPYLRSQSGLQRAFQVRSASACLPRKATTASRGGNSGAPTVAGGVTPVSGPGGSKNDNNNGIGNGGEGGEGANETSNPGKNK